VKQTSNIQFGSAVNLLHNNEVEKIFTNIFQPNSDTCTLWPLIIFMWGGGFQGGPRQDETGDCQSFAKRGFVYATSDYPA
jgi:carboxylesterase type B